VSGGGCCRPQSEIAATHVGMYRAPGARRHERGREGEGFSLGCGLLTGYHYIMDRSRTKKTRLSDKRDGCFMPGTMEERIAALWSLTVEACSLSGRYNAEQGLQRHITRVIRGKG
jgi:hypothetical protein